TFHGKILIERTDDGFVRFSDDKVVRIFRNCASRSNCCKPGAPSSADNAVDLIAMQKRATAAALGCDSFRKHFDDRIKILSRQVAIWVSVSDEFEEVVFSPRLASRGRNNLLRENIQRPWRYFEGVQ